MLRVTDVDYLGGYKLSLSFNTGEIKVVDLKEALIGNVFHPLLDLDIFIQFGLVNGTLEWVNGADFAPEFLYELAKKQETPRKKKKVLIKDQ